jgi:hypothetical protein
MENTLLQQAKKLYPKGTLFMSASNNLKSPLRITGLRVSEIYKDTIVNSEFGIVYDGESKTWAIKI